MAIKLIVRRNRQIVVPVRFGRAVTGATQPDAPDVDDRGFAMGTRPGTWGSTDTRGAMVSVQEGDTIKVKVLTEDIDPSVKLFVTSTNDQMAAISGPAAVSGGVFSLTGVKDSKNAPVKIEVRLGSITGPVLGELEPHIFQLRQLRVLAHLVTINGTATTQTAATLTPIFADVNKIWRAAGIEFLYDATETRSCSINGFAVAGTVTTHLPASFAEFSTLINFRDAVSGDFPDPDAINLYFVRAANEWLGLTLDHDSPRPGGFGIAIADTMTGNVHTSDAHAIAHELGHYLDSDIHAGENAAAKHVRDDIVSERRVMFDSINLDPQDPPYRLDVGYGTNLPGSLITVKDLSPSDHADPSDGEVARNRRRAQGPN
jgi:hypothetical protein